MQPNLGCFFPHYALKQNWCILFKFFGAQQETKKVSNHKVNNVQYLPCARWCLQSICPSPVELHWSCPVYTGGRGSGNPGFLLQSPQLLQTSAAVWWAHWGHPPVWGSSHRERSSLWCVSTGSYSSGWWHGRGVWGAPGMPSPSVLLFPRRPWPLQRYKTINTYFYYKMLIDCKGVPQSSVLGLFLCHIVCLFVYLFIHSISVSDRE